MKSLVKIIYTLLLFAFAATSCQKEDDLPEADRIFRPVGLTIATSNGIGVCDLIVRWNVIPGAESYTIELYSDSLLFAPQNLVERFVTRETEHIFSELRRGTRVSLRLRSNSEDLMHDSHYVEQTLLIPIENIFFPAQSGDIKATSITMRFQPGALATHLRLVNLGTGEIEDFPITESDREAGIIRVTGVTGDTNYMVGIFYGNEIRGQRMITTAYAPSGPNVVLLPEDADLSEVLTNVENIGKILILPENYEYTITSTIEIVGGMTIYGNPDGERASIESTTGSIFRFSPNASVPIEFVYCNFWKENPTNADYIFNMSAAFGNVEKLAFTNCRMANFRRNFFRVQGGGAGIIESLIIDNCEFDGMGANGDYAFMHVDVAGTAIRNISIKNSTFNVVGCHLIYFGQNRTIGCQSVTIENCTFYEALYSGASRWFINLGNVNNPENSVITLKNLILGSNVLNSTADPKPVHNGIKRFETQSIIVEEVYQTNDWIVQEATAVPDARQYIGSAANLFVDPGKGNFAIKDEGFAGKNVAGDPRWR